MSQARKYGFDTEFAADGKILRNGATSARLTDEQIEAERVKAYERGKMDALAAAEREAAAALQMLADAASAILTRLEAESRAMREEATSVAARAARKIAGIALDKFGAEHAGAAIEAAMDALRHQPRLVVKLPTALVDVLAPRIEQMREAHAYAAAVLVRPDPNLAAGEVTIDWSDGLIAYDPNETANRIDSLIEAALAAAETPGADT